MARPETHPGAEGGGADEGADGAGSTPPADVVRPGTGVVRPGTGVVRPGTGVVRPGAASPTEAATAKASAAVPEAPQKPLEPIRVVLPVIPVKPAKQGFLDRLVAPKPKKTEAELAEEEARREAEEARKAEAEEARKAEEAERKAEEAQRKADQARRKADAQARKTAEEAARARAEARAKAETKAKSKAEDQARKADDEARRAEQRARKAEEKVRRADTRAREKAARGDEDEDFDEDDDEPASPTRGLAGPAAPPISPPTRPAPSGPGGPSAPPRPGQAPTSPPRPGARPGVAPGRPFPPGGRPQRAPDRRDERDYDARPDYRVRARRPLRHWIAAAAAVVALGSGSAAIAGAATPPATVQFAEGIDTGETAPILSGLSANAPRPTVGGVAAAIGPLFSDSAFGDRVAGSIVDAVTGDSLYDINGAAAMTPASAAKLLTAAAVLHTRGPNYRIATRAVVGSSPGEVVLVGGGDPTLAAGATGTYPGAGRLDLLAEQVRKALGGVTPTRIVIDTSTFQGSTTGLGWAAADVQSGVIANITALMTDGARVNPSDTRSNAARYPQPDVAAGQIFAQALGLPAAPVTSGIAPRGARVLGEVFSPTIARIVEVMLLDSDNVVAEAMARQAALAKNLPGTFAGGAQATQAALTELGISGGMNLVDGSGLSDDNRVTASQLTAVLVRAVSPKYPQLRAVLSGLPVAGYSGTLSNRTGIGSVRAKTGTLNHVNALAGYVVDADGRLLAFAAVADATTNRARAEGALDRLAAAIAACGCR